MCCICILGCWPRASQGIFSCCRWLSLLLFLFYVPLTLLSPPPYAEIIPISAARDQGMPQLLTALLHHIPSGAPQYYPSDTLTTRDERFFVSEIVRECLLKLYKVCTCTVLLHSVMVLMLAMKYKRAPAAQYCFLIGVLNLQSLVSNVVFLAFLLSPTHLATTLIFHTNYCCCCCCYGTNAT